jgi:pimeloyl-ACP methyl ester carboxylesterase
VDVPNTGSGWLLHDGAVVFDRYTRHHDSGISRLAHVQVPTQVIGAPEDPINPPPHAAHLAATLGAARLTTIPGMGHTLSSAIIQHLAETILNFTAEVDKPKPA